MQATATDVVFYACNLYAGPVHRSDSGVVTLLIIKYRIEFLLKIVLDQSKFLISQILLALAFRLIWRHGKVLPV